jgi:hypothetical protein
MEEFGYFDDQRFIQIPEGFGTLFARIKPLVPLPAIDFSTSRIALIPAV